MRPDSRTSSGMLACGPTKPTDMLGTHTNDMRQRPTCLPRTFSRRASMALSMHTRARRARASHLASPQQHRIEHCDAPGCTPEHSGMPTHHSPLRRPSSRTAPTRMETMGEPPRRAAIGRRQGDDDRACRRQLGGLAAASLAEHIQDESWKQQRPFPLQKVAGNGVRWPPPTAAEGGRDHGNLSIFRLGSVTLTHADATRNQRPQTDHGCTGDGYGALRAV